jgi:hypothetical protein
LPVLVCVLLGIEALLAALGDDAGSLALQRVRLAALVLWITDLVALIILLGLQQVGLPPSNSERSLPDEE